MKATLLIRLLSILVITLNITSCQDQIDAVVNEAKKYNDPVPKTENQDPNNHAFNVINHDIVPVSSTGGAPISFGYFDIPEYSDFYRAPVVMNRTCNVFTNYCQEFSIRTYEGNDLIKIDLGSPHRFTPPRMATNTHGDVAIVWLESNEKLYLYLKINGEVIYQSNSLSEFINVNGSVKYYDVAMNDKRQVVIYYNSTYNDMGFEAYTNHYVVGYDYDLDGWRFPNQTSDNFLKSLNNNFLNNTTSVVRNDEFRLENAVKLKINQSGDERLLFHTYGGSGSSNLENYYLLYRNNLFSSGAINYNLTTNLRSNGYSPYYLPKIDSDMALDEEGNTLIAFSYVSNNDSTRVSPTTIYVSTDVNGQVSVPVTFNSSISYNIVGSFASSASVSAYVVHAYSPKVAIYDGKGQIVWLTTKEMTENASRNPAKESESIYVSEYSTDSGFTSEILVAENIVYNVKGLMSRWLGQPSDLMISEAPLVTAVAKNGKKVIIWAAQDNSGYSQLYRSIKAQSDSSWSAPEKLTSTRTNKSEVKLSTSEDGAFHIYWLDEFGNQAKLKNFSFK